MIQNIYLYIIVFGIVFWKTKNKFGRPIYSIILLIFLIASTAACYTAYMPNYLSLPKSNIGVIYHIIVLLMLLFAYKNIDSISDRTIQSRNKSVMYILAICLCFFNFIVIINDCLNIDISLIQNDVTSVRNAMADGDMGEVKTGWMRYPYFFGSCTWMAVIALAFYFMACFPQKKILIYALLISSTSKLIYGFSIASRDCMLVYFYVFIMLYMCVKKNINKIWLNKVKTMILVVGGMSMTFFVFVTILRFFLDADTARTQAGTIAYLGQGFVNFQSAFVEHPEGLTHGASKFPVFAGTSLSRFGLSDVLISSLRLNVFYTIVGSWVMDVGIWITVLIALIYSKVIKFIILLPKSPFTLIYIALAFHFAFYLIFYQVTSMTGSLLLIYFIIIIMDVLTRKKVSKRVS